MPAHIFDEIPVRTFKTLFYILFFNTFVLSGLKPENTKGLKN